MAGLRAAWQRLAWFAIAALVLVLGGSWFVLFIFLDLAITPGMLAPYEWCPLFPQPNNGIPLKPPRGTWERAVNDFFEHRPGRCVPGVLLVASSAIPLVGTLVRREVKPGLLLALVATNPLFLVVYALASHPVSDLPLLWLPQPRPECDTGYHLTWPRFLLFVVLSALLVYGQWWLRSLWSSRSRDSATSSG
ncbi:MAG: hypothetical protein K6V36_11160 [Anaerolineae bacterium]|nr:hypothetical protein [Anaerolineae bacterium]